MAETNSSTVGVAEEKNRITVASCPFPARKPAANRPPNARRLIVFHPGGQLSTCFPTRTIPKPAATHHDTNIYDQLRHRPSAAKHRKSRTPRSVSRAA